MYFVCVCFIFVLDFLSSVLITCLFITFFSYTGLEQLVNSSSTITMFISLLLISLWARPSYFLETKKALTPPQLPFANLTNFKDMPPSSCHVTKDVIYGGLHVDCSRLSISSLPLPQHWIPLETTTLLLQFNSLLHIGNGSFSTMPNPTSLCHLNLSHNGIDTITSEPFWRFNNLKVLDLSFNKIRLDRDSIAEYVFNGLRSLFHLDIKYNRNGLINGMYHNNLFNDLTNLSCLCLDTFNGPLNFGSLMNRNSMLKSLVLSGGATRITNSSFERFSQIKLEILDLKLKKLIYIEYGAFRFLSSLHSLSTEHPFLQISNVLECLSPFVKRAMKLLKFIHLNQLYKSAENLFQNIIITRHMARYLSDICVEEFHMTNSRIHIIEKDVIINRIWAKCVKIIDISGNPILGEIVEIYRLFFLRRLKSFNMSNRRYVLEHQRDIQVWKPPKCTCKHQIRYGLLQVKNQHMWEHGRCGKYQNALSARSIGAMNRSEVEDVHFTDSPCGNYSDPLLYHEQTKDKLEEDQLDVDEHEEGKFALFSFENMHTEFKSGQHQVTLHLPKQLEVFNLNSLSSFMLNLELDYRCVGGEKLRELYLSYCGISNFIGSIIGFSNLHLLDISHNNGTIIAPTFFNYFSSLLYLNMANMKLDPNFIKKSGSQLFAPLNDLKALDLSDNQLHGLNKKTFSNNSKLAVLILTGNRFQSIPFLLKDFPDLCLLDLRRNFLRIISAKDRSQLETHSTIIDSFSLKLDGNEFYCGCESIRFLSWLHRTRIHLDKKGNYSCTSDTGTIINTRTFEDIEALWRVCNGQQSFWITIFLVCLMLLAFICAIILPKHKTRIKAFAVRMIWNPTVMKKYSDYLVDVYIGYADVDANLACLQLRPYIEDRLGLRTYVRHRDLLPASDMAESIIEAIYSSWRIMLVVSKEFLQDQWSYFLLKAATHAVTTDNPGRLVLILVHNGQVPGGSSVSSRLPPCFLHAVQEESIIHIANTGKIDAEQEEALMMALLDNGRSN